jgi:VWFA-related protein
MLLALPIVVLAAGMAPPSFSVSVEAVYVDVFVRDEQGPVRVLAASDFVLRDNGVVQSVELVAAEKLPLTTLLVLDTSDSVRGEKLAQLQAASRALLRQYRAEDEVGLITFGHEIRLDVPPIANPQRVERVIDSLQPAGSTALVDALYAATVLAARNRTLVCLFTDGEDNMSILRVPDLVRVMAQSDVTLQAVGVVPEGPSHEESERVRMLRRLAEATGGRFWAAAVPDALAQAFLAVLEAMRTRYVLRFEPTGIPREGWHTLDVSLRRRGGTVHHRKAYFVAPAPGSTGSATSR